MATDQHRHRVEEGRGRGGVDQVGQHHDQRPLGGGHGPEGQLRVAVDRAGLEGVQGSDHVVAPRPGGADPGPHLVVEGDRAAAVAHRIGHRGQGGGGVDGDVEAGPPDRPRRRPPGRP